MPSPQLTLDAFTFVERLGEGAMGEVWRAVHREQQVELAIKVVHSRQQHRDLFDDLFFIEARAAASLDHPGICRVLDIGRLQPETTAPLPTLRVGSPWLAMELARGGSLADHGQRYIDSWETLKEALLQLLDGLAHAYSRSLVHRDLKPGNVLVDPGPDGQPRYLITDFGLAQAINPQRSVELATPRQITAGTPEYMAPEQIRGQWRDYGPWTDLYALGCMVHELVCGAPPFAGNSAVALATHHLRSPPPRLRPRFAVPRALEDWLARLMAKEVWHRYFSAGEARYALEQIPAQPLLDVVDPSAKPRPTSLSTARTLEGAPTPLHSPAQAPSATRLDSQSTTLSRQELMERLLDEDAHLPVDLNLGFSFHDGKPRVPAHWEPRQRIERPRSRHLSGLGLGLFGLRELPFVGRERERDVLWQAMREVHQENTCRFVIVRGTRGTGASRLVEWIGQRAEETGALRYLPVYHDPQMGPGQGIAHAIRVETRCLAMSKRGTYSRLIEVLGTSSGLVGASEEVVAEQAAVLTALVEPQAGWPPLQPGEERLPAVPPLQFTDSSERLESLRRFAVLHTMRKPTLFLIDDAQWGDEALELFYDAAQRDLLGPLAGLVVFCTREDLQHEHPRQAQMLDAIAKHPATTELWLDPLSEEDHRALIEQLLDMSPALVDRLVDHSEGRPMLAVQLVESWAEQGLFVLGEQGFELDDTQAERALPESVQEIWSQRLQWLSAQFGEQSEEIFALAAALGRRLALQEWQDACAILDLWPSNELIEGLLDRGLLSRRGDSLRFEHDMLRRVLEHRARERDRWRALHLACEKMLSEREEAEHPGMLARRGLHLCAGGAPRQAADMLLAAAHRFYLQSAYNQVLESLDRRRDALAQLELADDDPLHAQGWPLRAKILRHQGQHRKARELLNRTLDHSSPGSKLRAEALHGLGVYGWLFGEDDHYLQQAAELFERLHEPIGLARAMHSLGWSSMLTYNLGLAQQSFKRSLAAAQQGGDRRDEAWALHGLSSCAQHCGQLEQAQAHLDEARDLFEQMGTRAGLASCLHVQGEIHTTQGKHDMAEVFYLRSAQLWRDIGSSMGGLPLMSLGYHYLQRGDMRACAALVDQHSEELMIRGHIQVAMGYYCICLVVGFWREDQEAIVYAAQKLQRCWKKLPHPPPQLAAGRARILERLDEQPQQQERLREAGVDPDLLRAIFYEAARRAETI